MTIQRAALGTVIISLVVILALAIPYLVFGGPAGPYTLGAVAGIPSGFLLSLAVYWVTGPTLRVSVAKSEYDGKSDGYWIHLAVKNESWNVLGSGTASGCVGKVRFAHLRKWAVTWKSRPNPVREVPIVFAGGVAAVLRFADPLLFDQKRTETIRPDDPEEKWLDVAWRPKGVEDAYVSVAEHFQNSGLTLFDDAKIGVGTFPFSVEFEHSEGKTWRWYFALVNRGGPAMATESLFIRPATREERRIARAYR